MQFFEQDRRHGIDTRFGEVILNLVGMGYGWHALHAQVPNPKGVNSQFQVFLMLEGSVFGIPVSWLVGIMMCAAGIAGVMFTYSRFRAARFVVHALLLLSWMSIMLLFLTFKEPGIPLLNGMIFGLASAIVCATILYHEKHAPDHRCP